MIWIWIIGGIAVSMVATELAIGWFVRRIRPQFPWLIGPDDLAPDIDPVAVERHRDRGFDADLGWVRKPGEIGRDQTSMGCATFHMNSAGARANPGFEGKRSRIAAFGDSFTFCRLVNDEDTWPHFLALLANTNVLNFGVGNYGLDQAVLRFERELPRIESHLIVMGIVPETIARIHSFWKHYFEYGNVLAFKPRFTLRRGNLVLHPPAVRSPQHYFTYKTKLTEIQSLDHFFESRFVRDILDFPVLPKLIRRWRRHTPVLWNLFVGVLRRDPERARRRAFAAILTDNARECATLYQDENARGLLSAIVDRFCTICVASQKEPVLLVIPQPVDLAQMDEGRYVYHEFFGDLNNRLKVIDLSSQFHAHPARDDLYVEGPLGPHVSPTGNRIIADAIWSRTAETFGK